MYIKSALQMFKHGMPVLKREKEREREREPVTVKYYISIIEGVSFDILERICSITMKCEAREPCDLKCSPFCDIQRNFPSTKESFIQETKSL